MIISDKINNLLFSLSDNPGIYLFYNIKKELIYVGKATSLKNRVSSYFRGGSTPMSLRSSGRVLRPVEQMIHEVVDIKTIQTDSVLEAIILEANTIKRFQPKYNVDLKDDKSWNYIVITKDEFPQVKTIRAHELESHKSEVVSYKYLFGPYPGLKTVEMMKLLRKLFYISTCHPPLPNPPLIKGRGTKPCFYYQLGQCLGVCTREISPTDYKRKVINPLVKFLRGNKRDLIKDLEKKMKQASEKENFEEAKRLRDQIKNLQKIQDIALLNRSFVKENLEIKKENIRIEGYDISNLGETGKVGSMVVFENNEPNKKEYKKFKIKNVMGQSDVDCLTEVLERRLKHDDWGLPGVILVDGGIPQVNRAVEVIRKNKFKIPVVGIAKGRERKRNDFIIGFKDKGFINWVNENQDILIKVRDEAHRFAIAYQRSLRKIK